MPATRKIVDIERLRSLVAYEPETGFFVRKELLSRTSSSVPMRTNGYPSGNGYMRITVGGSAYACHRLAWVIHYGVDPDGLIDHLNFDRRDNRISNLRVVSHAENTHHRALLHPRNKFGLPGVVQQTGRKRYAAIISRAGGKQKRIGTYDTPEQAHEAYMTEKRKWHPAAFTEENNA